MVSTIAPGKRGYMQYLSMKTSDLIRSAPHLFPLEVGLGFLRSLSVQKQENINTKFG